ncbi:MAG: response regulator transcription factor [Deltaproteobacteria bacterium]|nr:response regulator transcription factor [Deltaproteobacteria bacterium]
MSITVFLADDHAVIRDGLRYMLEARADIRVIGEADNGRDTVRKVAGCCPDVVVMDIAMPELNGIEAASRLDGRCPATKIIILSVYSTSEHIYRALKAGAIGYVLKESAGRELIDAILAAHVNRRYLSRKIAEADIDEYIRERHDQSPLERLSCREREVLQLVVEGRSSAEIADIVFLSVKTVETYRSRLMKKLGIKDVPGLVRFAIQQGLTPL